MPKDPIWALDLGVSEVPSAGSTPFRHFLCYGHPGRLVGTSASRAARWCTQMSRAIPRRGSARRTKSLLFRLIFELDPCRKGLAPAAAGARRPRPRARNPALGVWEH